MSSLFQHRADLAPPMPGSPMGSPRRASRSLPRVVSSSNLKSPRLNGANLPSVKSNVVVIYAEPALQTTLTLSSDLTVKQVISKGQAEIESHLASSLGLPSVRIDPECTDFFPAADHNMKLGDLPGFKTIVCWPKTTNEDPSLTPSPLVDLLKDLQERRPTPNHLSAGRPRAASHIDGFPRNDSSSEILSRLAKLEAAETLQEELRKGSHARLTNLEREQAASLAKITLLEKQQKDLEETISKLQSTLTLSMTAVLGDEDAIRKIRLHVLLDRARAHLAKICGFDSWTQFQAETADNNDIFNTASRHIRRDVNISQHWKMLGSKSSSLWALIAPDSVDHENMPTDATANVESSVIGESINALPESAIKDDLISIYRAVYDFEP